jgi:hypothetical protein
MGGGDTQSFPILLFRTELFTETMRSYSDPTLSLESASGIHEYLV